LASKEALILGLDKAVRYLAYRYSFTCPWLREDLIQEGWRGVVQASITYRPKEGGTTFQAWARRYAATLMLRFKRRYVAHAQCLVSTDAPIAHHNGKAFDAVPDFLGRCVDYSGLEDKYRRRSIIGPKEMHARHHASGRGAKPNQTPKNVQQQRLMRALRAKRYLLEEQARYPFPTSLDRTYA
jgi:hypothetical protein